MLTAGSRRELLMNDSKHFDTRKLVLMAILTTIVILLQILGTFIRFGPFSISLVLMPIVIGAALLGSVMGAWLGLVFGFVVLISGETNLFLAINPVATVFVVLLKGSLAGFLAGMAYKLLAAHGKIIAAIAAAVVCPVVNTGIFILGGYIFFLPTFTEWSIAAGATSVTAFLFLGLAGVNFLFELGVNIILSPTIVRLIQYKYDNKERV